MATATFQISMEAASNRATYKGSFKVKCILSPLDVINADALYRKLLGTTNPNFASDYVGSLSYALAQLKYRIIDSEAWFKNNTDIHGSHTDDAILLHIFDEAVECESDYRAGIEEKYQKAKQAVVEAVDKGTLTDGKQEVKDEQE